MAYRIRVEGDGLGFSAAHFAVLPEGAERLHGHSYEVVVELEGALSNIGWVADFGVVRKIAASLCGELDHRLILPAASPALQITEQGEAYEVWVSGRRYVIPRGDVVTLPVENSTAERLAEWFAGRLLDGLAAAGVSGLRRVAVGVNEGPGQAAWYSRELGGSGLP